MVQNEKASGAWRAPEAEGYDDDDVNRHQHTSANSSGSKADTAAERLFSESISFLEQLRPNGPWVLTAIIPDGPADTITARTADEVDAFVHAHNGKRNLYYSVNPTKSAVFKKAKKADIAAVEYLLADLDPADGETPETAKARYLGQLNGSFEPKPTAIVDSGNGIQCLWRQTEPVQFPADEKREAIIADVEARSEALMLRLGAKAGTQNIDRILRLPGTTNLPNAKKRKEGRVDCPTKLLRFNGTRYSLDAFPLPEQNKPGTAEDGGQHARQNEEEARLERIIRNGESGEFNGDRSRAVWWVINEMLRRGHPTSTIVSTLLDRNNKISAVLPENHIRA